jgi:pyridinium-3,5-bisthiocarboxylic acid mononucleotide nickel chelatase
VTTAAWFHCFSGIAGDMALGSLLDAGADLDEVRELCQRLPATGWELDAEPVLRCGIAATHAIVRATDDGVIRTAAHITGLVAEARLPPRVEARALATFRALAEVEGALHRRPPEQVHFHEVGGIDALIDVVGTCAALEVLGVDEVHGSTVATGTGMVRAAHGMLPNPAPAVVRLLAAVEAPTRGLDVGVELTTPTGAALLTSLAAGFGPLPPMAVTATGFGAGTREIDGRPNVTQVVLGTVAESAERSGQPVALLEVNVDDATGEVLAHAVAALLDAGAHDAWVTPIVMKKGRPAHTVSALAEPALAPTLAAVLVAETGSLGVRGTSLERWPRERVTGVVEVDGRPVRVKVSPGRVKVEHDDAARVARRTGRPLREVLARAETAALIEVADAGADATDGADDPDRSESGPPLVGLGSDLDTPTPLHPEAPGGDDLDDPA